MREERRKNNKKKGKEGRGAGEYVGRAMPNKKGKREYCFSLFLFFVKFQRIKLSPNMSNSYQHQPPGGPYVAPPSADYPMKDGHGYPQNPASVESKAKGGGFWRGCCAGMCCCCLLDACF
ncbi:hypothetical protein AAG906_039597 [Vitis piasezkii]